jgi:predicted Ser/Thr protein kinase
MEGPGDKIGPYTLVRVLGEGGFGVVYLAERREPMVQLVALKVVKPGLDSRAVVQRFEAERQSLAVMDHPNVAKVMDAGSTATGRPYFVMEYVPGEPLTEFCDKRSLSVRDRLGLMAQVCEAVQHAHGKGIIHRDLKPSNVLVEMVDGNAVPKVIDFGVAKAIQRDETARTEFTMEGMLIGTPEYMSPEQAAGMLDIDTRTDVYALGVMLYELLTGAAPFEAESLRVAALSEIQRIIRDVEPPRPSTRLSEMGAGAETAAKNRKMHLGSLQRVLRRELEWIPLKAMRKERDRRYATAQEMAEDIRRYLDGRALSAGPESRVYRVRKFVARNRVGVGAGAAVLAAIVIGAGVSVWFGVQERKARVAESAAKARAVYEGETTAAVNTYLIEGVMTASDPDEDGADVPLRIVLERAADALDAKLGSKPEIEMRVAATLGRSLVRVGRPERGREVLEKARGLATGAAAGAPGVGEVLAEIDEYLGEALYRRAEGEGGAEAVKILRERLAAMGAGADSLERARLLNQLGGALKWSNPPGFDGSQKAYEEALALRTARLPAGDLDVLVTRHNLAMLELRRGQKLPVEQEEARRKRFEEALRVEEVVLKDSVAALGPEHSQTLVVRCEVARLLNLVGRTQESERMYAETIAAMRKVLTTRHWRTLETLGNYSMVLKSLGRHEEEARVLEEAVEGYRFVRGPTHGGTQMCAEWLATAMEKIGCAKCGARGLERVYADLVSGNEPVERRRGLAGKIAGVYQRMGNTADAAVWKARAEGE